MFLLISLRKIFKNIIDYFKVQQSLYNLKKLPIYNISSLRLYEVVSSLTPQQQARVLFKRGLSEEQVKYVMIDNNDITVAEVEEIVLQSRCFTQLKITFTMITVPLLPYFLACQSEDTDRCGTTKSADFGNVIRVAIGTLYPICIRFRNRSHVLKHCSFFLRHGTVNNFIVFFFSFSKKFFVKFRRIFYVFF